MNHNCNRCGRNNHLELECLARTDINGNILDSDAANSGEYTTLIPKNSSKFRKFFNGFRNLGSTLKRLLEVPRVEIKK